MTIYDMIDKHPILTFFLACILSSGVVGTFRALRGLPDEDSK